jgi:GNAT superfamily N-acetyltransferase
MADIRVVELVEQAEAQNAIACAASHARIKGRRAKVHPFNSGYLVSAGPGSAPAAVGAGRRGRFSQVEIDEMEKFFDSHTAGGFIPLCPRTSSDLHRQLHELGYRGCDLMSVMACAASRTKTLPPRRDVVIEPVRIGTRPLWERTISAGFESVDHVDDDRAVCGKIIANIPEVFCYLARCPSGEPLGGGAMIRHGRIAIFFGDSTLPRARGRGVHKELIRRRLLTAKAIGCDLATALTVPASISQRNYERSGFEVAYTRLGLAAAA